MVLAELECDATLHLKKSDGHEYMKKHLTIDKARKAAKAKVPKPLIQANNNDNDNKEKQVIIEIVPDKLNPKHPDHEQCEKTIKMTLSIALIEIADAGKGKFKKPTRAIKVDLGKCEFRTGKCANTELFTADNSRTIGEHNSHTENSHSEAHSTAGTTHSDHSTTHSTPEAKRSDANHGVSTITSHQPSASSHTADHLGSGNHAIDGSQTDKSKNSIHSSEVDSSFATEYLDLPGSHETNKAGSHETASTENKTTTHTSPPHGGKTSGIEERSRELSAQPGVHTTDPNKRHDETPEATGSPTHISPAHSNNHTHREGLLIQSPEGSSTSSTTSEHSTPRQSQESTNNHRTHNETPHGLAGLLHVNSHSSGHSEVGHTEHDGTVGKSHTSDLVRSKPVHFFLHGHLYCGENEKYVKNEVSATIRLRGSHIVEDELSNKSINSDELHVEEDFLNHQNVKCAIGPANVPICKYTPVKFGKIPRYIAPATLVDARLSNVCKKKSGHECKKVEAIKQIQLDIEPKEKECSNYKPIRMTIQLDRMDQRTDERTNDVIYQVNLGSCDFRTGHCSLVGKYIGK
ncbi:hypothetical protein DdX_04604 [Ditylenchus destructor]|uniref:Uncharacterized protein n=1 Tax=Ditylenchus destructor TaxID=166010 RepID=A0AAD4N9W8_9BILA|nr:hypothetical protein DdX_04604 [Ditylenchus destructor]